MIDPSFVIKCFAALAKELTFENEILAAHINRIYVENNWLTKENYSLALDAWRNDLTNEKLEEFAAPYSYCSSPKNIGIIMAGNIPLVGMHDLLCVLLSGNKAIVKPSSEDKHVITYVCSLLSEMGLENRIAIIDKLEDIDGVIATGSNNTFRYFEYYFRNTPSLLRKNRTSIAVLSGEETTEDLNNLAHDVFQYFGLGCRNVSNIFIPESINITHVLDHMMTYQHLSEHNKYANNYTYHRALLLMNNEQHLDTGFALFKERKELQVPLACVNYYTYSNIDEMTIFTKENKEDIQCVVGNYLDLCEVPYGKSQKPRLQDFADNVDTFQFLNNL